MSKMFQKSLKCGLNVFVTRFFAGPIAILTVRADGSVVTICESDASSALGGRTRTATCTFTLVPRWRLM